MPCWVCNVQWLTQSDIFKVLVLSYQQSKTQRYLNYSDIIRWRAASVNFWEAGTRECHYSCLKNDWRFSTYWQWLVDSNPLTAGIHIDEVPQLLTSDLKTGQCETYFDFPALWEEEEKMVYCTCSKKANEVVEVKRIGKNQVVLVVVDSHLGRHRDKNFSEAVGIQLAPCRCCQHWLHCSISLLQMSSSLTHLLLIP